MNLFVGNPDKAASEMNLSKMRIVALNLARFLLIWIVAPLFIGCTTNTTKVPTLPTISTQGPANFWPTHSWQPSSPEKQGVDSEILANMMETIGEENLTIESVLIIRNGFLVMDAVIYPFEPNAKHNIFSCTKSVISALIGISIDQGFIESVDQPVLDFFPNRIIQNLDLEKEAMTLEDLLTMSSGLDCRDSYLYRWEGLEQIRQSEDWVQFVLDLPMTEEPGTLFEYCNGASILLSAIIQETTGMSAKAFAGANLFGSLGITDLEWAANPQGISIGYSELYLLPHDMAKIGHLYLNGGNWDGKQIVSSDWVEASSRKHISATLEDGYGYQWWTDEAGYFMALGYGGQFIFVIPDKEMVVVFVSSLSESEFYVPQTMLIDSIIPAALSSTSLPENPDGVERLKDIIEALSKP